MVRQEQEIMTKADIIRDIANRTGVDSKEVRVVVEAFLDGVKAGVSSGKSIYFRGFGSFTTKKRARKIGRNITKNTSVIIEAHTIPFFKPAKDFSKEVYTKLPIQD